jgi:hypothetical protein
MPALKNAKHEAFANLIAQAPKRGLSNAQCYREAGYRVAAGPACDAAASRLLSSDKVQARIAELVQPTVRKTRATVDTLAQQFDAVFDGAMGSAQFGAAGSAATAKAKLLGFMREKIEVGGVGDFDGMTTVEQVVDRLIVDFGDHPHDMVRLMREMLELAEERISNMAKTITPSKPRSSEAKQALAISRPGKRHRSLLLIFDC